MFRKMIALFLALTLLGSALPVFAQEAAVPTPTAPPEAYISGTSQDAAEQSAAITDNINAQNYSTWSQTVKSYLVDNRDGTVTRVEATDTAVTIERYDTHYQFLSRQTVPMELPLFGGFYEGSDYYFLVFGQTNPEEDDNTEVIRVVRYSKDWLRLGHASLFGANTYIPFDAGSLRMTQYRDMLYVLTCHEMYRSSDGFHHQANLIFSVSIPEMEITDQFSDVFNVGYGYVSHSFNQFILTDGDKLLTLNHGDAYPRSAVIVQYGKPAGQAEFTGACTFTSILRFTGEIGQNSTGASLGAFELSDSAYLTAGNSIVQDDSVSFYGQRNIFLAVTPRGDIGSADTALRWITSYEDDADIQVSTPHLVRIRGDYYLLLWTENGALRYVFVDDMGNTVSNIYKANIPLSDCKPIVWNNAVCWYVTQSSKPAFFSIPLDRPGTPQISAAAVTVTLESGGGTPESDTLTVSYGQPYGALPVPQRKSAYQFLGWYPYAQYSDDAPAADRITADTIVTTFTNHTLYAHWKYLSHTCVFEKAEVVPADCTMTYYVCVHCDNYYCIIDGSAQHTWDEGTVTVAPTFSYAGEMTYLCTICGAVKTEPIPPTSSQHDTSCDGGASCPSAKFRDVSAKDWYHPYVDYAVTHGLFNGMTETTFEPETAMTRAMLVMVLWRYEGMPKADAAAFTDVTRDAWYAEAVAWAAANGVVNGVGNNRFDPEGEITREQMAVILFRYASGKGIDTEKRGDLSGFPDRNKVASWAKDAMQWTVAAEIIGGSDGKLLPQGAATRAQVATILMRFIENVAK